MSITTSSIFTFGDSQTNLTNSVANTTNATTLGKNTSDEKDLITCQEVAVIRISSLTFTFIVILMLFYIITALIVYVYKKIFKRCKGRHNFANRAALIIHSIIICGAIFVLVYIAIEVPLVSYPSMQFCALYHRIKTLTFIPAVACFYFALWLRIYVLFYKNSLIKINTGKLMYYVNISSLPLLIIMMSSNMLLFLDIPTNGFAGCGCKEDRSKKTAAKWAFLFLSTTIFQAVMLISFANPLYLHHRKMLKRGCGRRPLWILLIKRASFVASVCFISDLANFIFAATYVGETTYVKHVVFSCNLLVNLAGTILSYASWRERIFPFKLNFSKIKVVAR